MVNTKEIIIRHLGLAYDKEHTIRQISLDSEIPYMTLSRAVKELEREELIITKKAGNSIFCTLNRKNSLTKYHLILASESFKNSFLRKKPLFRKIAALLNESLAKNDIALLFGSYASGKEQAHSDIDIAFISEDDAKKAKNKLREIEQIHGVEISEMVFSKKQFAQMLKSAEENAGKQIFKNHIVLNNPELFWNLVYETNKWQ
jgi:predicted nucleotidyltransferase